MPRVRRPRLLWLVVPLAIALTVAMAPQVLTLILVAPIGMITLIVAAPSLLPAGIWLAGMYHTGEIISGIYREKNQYTYDLICASAQGKLKASWSFATGVVHRGGTLLPLRWGARAALRCGLAALGGLTLFTLLLALTGAFTLGIEQARLLLLPLLFLALYFTHLTQCFVVSHLIGLLASGFEWSKRDAMLVGLFAYTLLNSLPFVGGSLVYLLFRWLVFEPQPLALMAAEALALLLIIAARELTIMGLWRALRRRMGGVGGSVSWGFRCQMRRGM